MSTHRFVGTTFIFIQIGLALSTVNITDFFFQKGYEYDEMVLNEHLVLIPDP